MRKMYQEQRLSKMLELLEDKEQLAAKDMVDYFQVSKDTIRRDFSILSERRLVQRTHGGIIPLENSRQIPSFTKKKRPLLTRLWTFSNPIKSISLMCRRWFSSWLSKFSNR